MAKVRHQLASVEFAVNRIRTIQGEPITPTSRERGSVDGFLPTDLTGNRELAPIPGNVALVLCPQRVAFDLLVTIIALQDRKCAFST